MEANNNNNNNRAATRNGSGRKNTLRFGAFGEIRVSWLGNVDPGGLALL